MAPALVQSAVSGSFVAGNPAVPWGFNNVGGNLLLAAGMCRGGSGGGTISDGANVWKTLWSGITAAGSLSVFDVFYCLNCLPSGSPLTVTYTPAFSNNALAIAEFSGVNKLDQQSVAGTPSVGPFASPPITAAQAAALYFAITGCASGTLTAVGPDVLLRSVGPALDGIGYQILSTIASTSLAYTATGTGFTAIADFIFQSALGEDLGPGFDLTFRM